MSLKMVVSVNRPSCMATLRLLASAAIAVALHFFPGTCVAGHAGADPDVVWLALESNPSSAAVEIDSMNVGVTPLCVQVTKTQLHRVRLLHDGYRPLNRVISLPDGDTLRLVVRMRSIYAWARLASSVAGDRISIDGHPADSSAGQYFNLSPGEHAFRFANSTGDRWIERSYKIDESDSLDLRASLGVPSGLPTVMSAVVPGMGQMYDRSVLKGSAILAGFAALVIFRQSVNGQRRDAAGEYDDLLRSYGAATNEETAARLRSELLEKRDRVNEYARRTTLLNGVLAAAYALNLLDAFFHHRQDDILTTVHQSRWVVLTPYLGQTGREGGIELRYYLWY